MKDIYLDMNNQNILKLFNGGFDLKLDNSEFFDFIIESDIQCDIILDSSEYYDFELCNNVTTDYLVR